jgi:hypothetical protein
VPGWPISPGIRDSFKRKRTRGANSESECCACRKHPKRVLAGWPPS